MFSDVGHILSGQVLSGGGGGGSHGQGTHPLPWTRPDLAEEVTWSSMVTMGGRGHYCQWEAVVYFIMSILLINSSLVF